METFQASVQYNDLKGSVAADNADMTDATSWLKNNKYIKDDEFVIGISMWAGENHGKHDDPVSVTFLVKELGGNKTIPDIINDSNETLSVKKVEVDMNIVDFMALFKRLEITLSTGGMLEGIEYSSN
jgi:hypothetical protein